MTQARLSTAGNPAVSPGASLKPFPDWLKYSLASSRAEIDDVRGAGAVDVREPDTARVEQVGLVEHGARSMAIFAPNRP